MKTRGSAGNPHNRFHHVRVHVDPAWTDNSAPETRISPIQARSLITENRSPDVPFEQSLNPYQGCEHGCIYCYARPSHAYLDLSPGLDFETRIFAKVNAADVLRRELARPGYRCRTLAFGANTDAYQPAEKRLGITRQLLEVCSEHRQPVTVITKSALIRRDIDVLAPMARDGLASVAVSLTTLDHGLKRILEPRASGPAARLRTIQALSDAGIPVSVLMAPVIPRINDMELERLLALAAGHGARSAGYILLRLPHEVASLFKDWLKRHFPDRAEAIMNLMRHCHGGRDYNPTFGLRMRGTGHYARLIGRRFELARRRAGLAERGLDLDCSRFRVPDGPGRQRDLFADDSAAAATA